MYQSLGSNYIVRVIFEERSRSGLVIPKTALEYKQYHAAVYGEILSVGSGCKFDLKPGDKIIFQRHEGMRLFKKDCTLIKLKEKWVLAKVEE